MQKVKEKVSGCFRQLRSANEFTLIRSYLMTCQKNNLPVNQALSILFNGGLPSFISQEGRPEPGAMGEDAGPSSPACKAA
jgi:hypothetical protein